MNGLEVLKKLQELLSEELGVDIAYYPEYELLGEIGKELKALEIIKDTRVDINFIKLSINYDDYCRMEAIKVLNNIEITKQIGITKEEYNLLKEVLK